MRSPVADMSTGTPPDHGALPRWETAELSAPPAFSFRNLMRVLGPGAILAATSVGGGEWLLGPAVGVKYSTSIFLIVTVAILLQVIFNIEGIRYTLYTGEPIYVGIMRLKPGPKFWAGFYTLPTKGREAELSRVYVRDWFVQAPLVLCVCAVPAESWVRKYDGWNAAEVDASIVMSHIVLAAAEEGLATCWIAAFNPAAAREVPACRPTSSPRPSRHWAIAADDASPKKRRPLTELVKRDRW